MTAADHEPTSPVAQVDHTCRRVSRTCGRPTAGRNPPGGGEDAAEDVGGEEGDVPLHLQQVQHQRQEHAHREEQGPADQQVGGSEGHNVSGYWSRPDRRALNGSSANLLVMEEI